MIVKTIKWLLRLRKAKIDPIGYAREIGVRIGENCRLLAITPATFGSEPYLVRLGDHVTVTSGVRFVTHDGGVWVFRRERPDIDVFGPIKIGNNVFVGINTIIFPGVTVGDNCIIGAGSLVNRDIAPNTVVAGVPAKPVKTLDDYWQKVAGNAINVRSLPEKEKKTFLLKHFNLD